MYSLLKVVELVTTSLTRFRLRDASTGRSMPADGRVVAKVVGGLRVGGNAKEFTREVAAALEK